MSDSYIKGYCAYTDGGDNPYERHSNDWYSWARGCYDAMIDSFITRSTCAAGSETVE